MYHSDRVLYYTAKYLPKPAPYKCGGCCSSPPKALCVRVTSTGHPQAEQPGGNVGYCLAMRACNLVCHETTKDLECTRVGNQCPTREVHGRSFKRGRRQGQCGKPDRDGFRSSCKFLRRNCSPNRNRTFSKGIVVRNKRPAPKCYPGCHPTSTW